MSAALKEQPKPDALTRQLWQIAGSGDLQRLEEVLANGADVNASDQTGITALMRAAYHGQLTVVRALIEHGADLNAKDSDGLTPLMVAKHAGHEEIVEALLSCGAENVSRPIVHKSLPAESAPETVGNDRDKTQTTRTRKVRTLHEPPEIWDLVHTTQSDSNHESGASEREASVGTVLRTLHEPPEIWDLVHTTQSDSNHRPRAAERRASAKTLALAAFALVIGGGAVFGLLSLRGSGSASDATQSEHEQTYVDQKAESTTATSSSKQKPVDTGERTRAAEPKTIASSSAQPAKLAPAGHLTGVRTVDEDVPDVAPVSLSPKKSGVKSVTKPRKKPSASASFFLPDKEDDPQRLSTLDSARGSGPAKKDSTKTQSQAGGDPPKTTTAPKPKVIQWP